jgi:hypothetical protein
MGAAVSGTPDTPPACPLLISTVSPMNIQRQKNRLVSLLLLTGALGCGHAKGAPDEYDSWATVTTRHFDVHTPLSAGTAEEYAQQLELVYTAMTAMMFPNVELPPTEVLVFDYDLNAREAAAESTGQSNERRPSGGVIVLVDRQRRTTQRSTVNKFSTPWQVTAAREIAARLVRRGMPHAPAWFHEGVARFLETVQVEPGEARFGRREPMLQNELAVGRIIPLGQLLAEPKDTFHHDWPRSHEASAWGFVAYLLTADGGALRPKFDLIAAALEADRGGEQPSLSAVQMAFPDVPFAELANRVQDYDVNVLGRKTTFPALSVPLPSVAPVAGTAAPAATDHVRGLLLALKHR